MIPKNTFPEGTKVRIRRDLSCHRTYENYLDANSDMVKFAGKIALITGHHEGTGWNKIDLDKGEWHWSKEMFEQEERPVEPTLAKFKIIFKKGERTLKRG